MRIGPFSLDQLQLFAQKFGHGLKGGDVVFLYGTLGAGKTTFSKNLIQSVVGKDVDVTSPTFSLLHTYDGPHFTFWHFDLYRIEDESELEALGLDDALYDGVSLIEWPQLLEKQLQDRAMMIEIIFDEKDENRRYLKITLPQGREPWFD